MKRKLVTIFLILVIGIFTEFDHSFAGTDHDSVLKLLNSFIDQYQGYEFNTVISLGDKTKIKAAMYQHLDIKVNTKLGSEGRYLTWDKASRVGLIGYLTGANNLLEVKQINLNARPGTHTTLWHEFIHHMINVNGGESCGPEETYTELLEDRVTWLRRLARFDRYLKSIKKLTPAECKEIKKQWRDLVNEWNNFGPFKNNLSGPYKWQDPGDATCGTAHKFYTVQPNKVSHWDNLLGIDVSLQKIKKLYEAKIKKMADQAGLKDCNLQVSLVPVEESLALLIDTSGSMADNNKIRSARSAALDVINRVGPGIEVAVITYSGGCSRSAGRILQDFTDDRQALENALDLNNLRPGGGTPMSAALDFAYSYTSGQGQGNKREIFLMCDGQNDCGSISQAGGFQQRTIPVTTIGFDISSGSKADLDLRELAQATGGSNFSAQDQKGLRKAFSRAVLSHVWRDVNFNSMNLTDQTAQQVIQSENNARQQIKEGDLSGALNTYKRVLPLASNSPEMNFNASLLYEDQDQLINALKHAERYLELSPGAVDRENVENRIASLKEELKRNPRAQYNPADCSDIYRWAQKEQRVVKRTKNAVRRQAILEILINSQKGDCEKARNLTAQYKQQYQ